MTCSLHRKSFSRRDGAKKNLQKRENVHSVSTELLSRVRGEVCAEFKKTEVADTESKLENLANQEIAGRSVD